MPLFRGKLLGQTWLNHLFTAFRYPQKKLSHRVAPFNDSFKFLTPRLMLTTQMIGLKIIRAMYAAK